MKPTKILRDPLNGSQPQKKQGANKAPKMEEPSRSSAERVSPHSLFNLFTANIIKKNILR
jgi:hypothetical protein